MFKIFSINGTKWFLICLSSNSTRGRQLLWLIYEGLLGTVVPAQHVTGVSGPCRGGGERGLGWHQAGSFLQKHKGLEDLASCIHHLYQLGVSQPVLANLSTRSAGAVLAGALCNQYPELLRTVSMQVRHTPAWALPISVAK